MKETSKNGPNCGRESAVGAVFYAFSFSSSSWTNIMRKLTVSRPQDSQIVPAPQWRVAMLPIPAPSANSRTTPKYVSALWSISLSLVWK